jgi:hypothetical protein
LLYSFPSNFEKLKKCQGDQIGRIFARCAIVYNGQFLKIPEVAHIFGLPFSTVKVIQSIWQKLGWATFWVIFHKLIWTHCFLLPSYCANDPMLWATVQPDLALCFMSWACPHLW